MTNKTLDIKQIQELIPHRYPFLLIDKVIDYTENVIEGYKNLSINEPFFCGHFPNDPIMPGVLQCEAAAQLAALLLKTHPGYENKLILFAGIDGVRFKRMVVPGDRLDIRVDVIKVKASTGKAKFSCSVDGEVSCYGEFLFLAVNR